jgi:cytochrome c-type biogenesis protein CcmH/NrfF
MTPRRLTVAIVAALVAALAAAALAGAAPVRRASAVDIEDEVMCVTCNVPLSIAESPQADQERRTIARLVDQGLTKDQVKDRLVTIYGRNVLAKPSDHGFGLAAYLVPIVVVLAVLAALAVTVPRWRRRRASAQERDDDGDGRPGPTLSPADASRLEQDLARYEV